MNRTQICLLAAAGLALLALQVDAHQPRRTYQTLGGVIRAAGIASRVDAGAGAVTVQEALVRQTYLKASNTDANDEFGYAVAISGDTLRQPDRGR